MDYHIYEVGHIISFFIGYEKAIISAASEERAKILLLEECSKVSLDDAGGIDLRAELRIRDIRDTGYVTTKEGIISPIDIPRGLEDIARRFKKWMSSNPEDNLPGFMGSDGRP